MAHARSGKPTARARAQRERILEAAFSCFVEMGFHAAGMAAISARAEMSPGLIYRYFPEGKSAIIQTIIENQMELAEEEIRQIQQFDLPADLMSGLERTSDDCRRMNPSLMLELSAMATRDPTIAAIVTRFDSHLRNVLAESFIRTSVAADVTPLSPQDASAKALVVQLIYDGLLVRQAREPSFDRESMSRALREFFDRAGHASACG